MAHQPHAHERPQEDRDLQASIIAIHRQYFSYNPIPYTETITLSVPDTLGQEWDDADVEFIWTNNGTLDQSLSGDVYDPKNGTLILTVNFNKTGAGTSTAGKRRIQLHKHANDKNYRLWTVDKPAPDGSHLVIKPPEDE